MLILKYTHEYPEITITLNNNKQDINKDTQPESDKRVNETRFEDELSEYNYYKIFISDGHKYTNDYIINNILNYVASEILVPIKYRENGNGTNFSVEDKEIAVALLQCVIITVDKN